MFSVEIPMDKTVSNLKSLIKKTVKPRFNNVSITQMDLYKLNFPPSQLRGSEPNLVKLREPWKPIETFLSFEFRPFVKENIHLVVTPVHWKEVNCTVKYKHETRKFIWQITQDIGSLSHFKNKLSSVFTEISNIDYQSLKIKSEDVETYEVKNVEDDNDLYKIVWADNYRVNINVELTVL
ncbi:uncharacterized protein OCT59_002909 [Rhizophagus irregularis]|nr:hypothetical protein OCT59_002909 [Rhizophagus irregularis]CAG8630788.1 19378_t:CDS:1 [Rhizophagus irregularis]